MICFSKQQHHLAFSNTYIANRPYIEWVSYLSAPLTGFDSRRLPRFTRPPLNNCFLGISVIPQAEQSVQNRRGKIKSYPQKLSTFNQQTIHIKIKPYSKF